MEKSHSLAKLVSSYQAFKRAKSNSGTTKNQKFEAILLQLKQKDEFSDLKASYSPKTLENKFKEDQEKVLLKFGISKSDVNLSGLKTKPTDYEQLHLDMAEEAFNEKEDKSNVKINKKQKKRLLGSIEKNALQLQGKRRTNEDGFDSSTSTVILVEPCEISETDDRQSSSDSNTAITHSNQFDSANA